MREMLWVIPIPVWGPRYVMQFTEVIWPALQPVLPELVHFEIYSDFPNTILECLEKYPHTVKPLPDGRSLYVMLSKCYKSSIEQAPIGSAVALINGDMYVSKGAFAAAEQRFVQGKRLIFCSATRTIAPPHGAPPALGIGPVDLAKWSLEAMHSTCKECVYQSGTSGSPWAVYFTDGVNVILRGFHLHPFAVYKSNELSIHHGDLAPDLFLTELFDRSEIHVVTDPNELVLAEASPIHKTFPNEGPLAPASIAEWARKCANETHRWFFTHRIVVKGTDATICDAPAEQVLKLLET